MDGRGRASTMPYRGSYESDPYSRKFGDRFTNWRHSYDYASRYAYYPGRYKHPQEGPPHGIHPSEQRGRLMSEDSRMGRAYSHDRLDMQPPYPGASGMGPPHWDDPAVEMYLSQPSPSHWGFAERGSWRSHTGGIPGIGTGPGMMGFDPRAQMAGPLGHSLSQPGETLGTVRSHTYNSIKLM